MRPWLTGSGEAVLVMLTLDCVGKPTTVEAVAELFERFGSPTVLETEGVAEMTVPEATPAFTLTRRGKLAEAPAARVPVRVQVKVPVEPIEMVLQDQPAGTVKPVGIRELEESVVLAGMVTVNVALVSVAGPLLVTVSVKVTLLA